MQRFLAERRNEKNERAVRDVRLPFRIHSRIEQPDRNAGVKFLPISKIRHDIEIRCVESGDASCHVDQRADTLVERTDFQHILFAQTNRWEHSHRCLAAQRIERPKPTIRCVVFVEEFYR